MNRSCLLLMILSVPISAIAQTAPADGNTLVGATIGGTIGGIPFPPPKTNPPPSRDNKPDPAYNDLSNTFHLDAPEVFAPNVQKFDQQKFNFDVKRSLEQMRSTQQFR